MSDRSRDVGYQVIVRLPLDISERLDEVTKQYMKRSLLGVRVGKATAAREAIVLGLPLLEQRFKDEIGEE